jgi:cupin fold WbuC family metalloprotein
MDQHRRIQNIDDSALDELIAQARQVPRLRSIRSFHMGDWEHCHRMLNALIPGTYVRPHCHASEYQSESFILLRGKLALLFFDDAGQVNFINSRILSPSDGLFGVDIPPAIWHSLVALEETVIFEVKGHPAGGYVAERDKNFAPWAPEEGSPKSVEYLLELESAAFRLERT